MKVNYLAFFLLYVLLSGCSVWDSVYDASGGTTTDEVSMSHESEGVESLQTALALPTPQNHSEECYSLYRDKHYPIDEQTLLNVCQEIQLEDSCYSEQQRPIFHYQKDSDNPTAKKILVLGGVHGDERSSSVVTFKWIERLMDIDSRNTWRIIPMNNPDGFYINSRMNANGVDLNRNFPTRDWEKLAYHYWHKRYKKDPRRYPGKGPASESETVCAISHVKDFRPDFVISVHTPYGILDFDGPPLKFPQYKGLPWSRLGNYPGSLGRYMWVDHKIPVLTIELKGNEGSSPEELKRIEELQDLSGLVAIMTDRYLKKMSEDN